MLTFFLLSILWKRFQNLRIEGINIFGYKVSWKKQIKGYNKIYLKGGMLWINLISVLN